jgi:hypothetical protein
MVPSMSPSPDRHLEAIGGLIAFLAQVWYVTLPTLGLGAFGVWRERRSVRAGDRPDYRLLGIAWLWPMAAVVLGARFADLVEQAESIETIRRSLLVPQLLLFGGVIHYVVVAWRQVGLRRLAGYVAPLFLWVSLACALMASVAISGYGRQWH